jgi:hypothetical protein
MRRRARRACGRRGRDRAGTARRVSPPDQAARRLLLGPADVSADRRKPAA